MKRTRAITLLILCALVALPGCGHVSLYPTVIVTDQDGAFVYDTLTPKADHE